MAKNLPFQYTCYVYYSALENIVTCIITKNTYGVKKIKLMMVQK